MASADQSISNRPTHESNLEQISEEANQQCGADAAGAPSLLSSSSEQQFSTVDPSAIYQIDFDVEHLGKNKPQSKRMAIWRYGIPQETSSSVDGATIAGHEAKLTWSTHSGKYTISVDGEDVFSSVAKGSVLEHKWRWSHGRGCAVEDDEDDSVAMRIVACRKPPTRSSKDFRCYEFIIRGRVFRDLPVEGSSFGGDFQNEENSIHDDGKLMTILDVIEPGWRASGFA